MSKLLQQTTKRAARLSLILIVMLLGTQLSQANILPTRIYVTVGGAGLKNGSSWSNAMDSTAFRTILPKAQSGDTFWVAAGVYHPDLSNDTNKFEVPIDVCLYGGFAGNETALSQRNIRKNRTILDGAGHIYNVVYLNNVTTTTVFDGFTVINGNNGASGTGGIKGLYAGAAIFYGSNINGGNPQISNDSFANNYAYSNGGAIYNYGNFDANATIINCSFINNSAGAGGIGGGAIAVFSVNYGEAYTPIINCFFKGNTSANYGGAIVNYSTVGFYCYPTITNSVFIGNNAANGGGAIYNGMNNGLNTVNPTISNCSFANNTANSNNSTIYNDNSSRPSILNCILWDGSAAEISDNNGSYSSVSNSDIYGGWQGSGSNNITSNPIYVNLAKDSLQLVLGSFAINTGSNYDTITGVETDIAGNARIQQGTIDMGAYESPYAKITRYYVTPGGKGNKGGSSWSNAMDSINFRTNLPGAAYGDTFWVAAGVYHPDLSSADNNFTIPSGVALYGGFAGTEKSISQRNIHKNITALDGARTQNNIVYLYNTDSTTVINGFTISNGYNVNGSGGINSDFAGAGIYIYADNGNFKPLIANDSFVNNFTNRNGGAIYNHYASPTIMNCSFVSDSTNGNNYGGGAIYNIYENNQYTKIISTPVITNCVFTNNYSGKYGGAITSYYSSGMCKQVITNCVFNSNTSNNVGGAITNTGNYGACEMVAVNDVFNNNYSTNSGGAIYHSNEYSYDKGTFTNCVFTHNFSNVGYGNAIYDYVYNAYTSNNTLTNCTFGGNGVSNNVNYVVYSQNNDTNIFTNCILWDSANNEVFSTGGRNYISINYSDVYNGSGVSNISANPLFKNPSKGDFSILTCSPAFNAATATGAPATDVLGNARPALGGYDMGAYETQTLSPSDTISFKSKTIKSNGGAVTLTVKFIGTGPWIFTYTDGVNTFGPDTAKTSPYALIVNPLFTTVYTINSFTAPVGSCTVFGKQITDTVRLAPQTRFYVTPGGAGTKTGTSWANAMDSTIFRNNIALALYHDTFWVAKGVYHPNLSNANNTFIIPSGVALYGGFAGTETAISQSRPRKNITALDGAHFINNIVYFKSVDSTTVLDGFTLSNGYNSNDNNGNGGIGANYWGAAIFNDGSSVNSKPVIANDSFVNNFTDNDGGAISNNDGSPTIVNCAFVNNSTYGYDEGGGAIYNYTSNNSITIIIKGCRFIGNGTGEYGGAMCNYNDNNLMNVLITNSLFKNNNGYDGGAIYNLNYGNATTVDLTNSIFYNNSITGGSGAAIYNDYNSQIVTNCTFVNNFSTDGSGYETIIDRRVNDIIINSILWDNTTVEVNAYKGSKDSLSYTDIRGGWKGLGSNNISGYPLFADTAIGNVNITSCSPAFNTATSIGAPTKDILGNPRPALGGYDMGALELQTLTPVDTVQFITGTIKSAGGTVTLKIRFTGTAPWYFTYTDGVHNYGPIKATASPYSLVVNPIFNTVYTLTGLVSPVGVCANYGAHNTDTVNVTPRTRYYVTPGGAGIKSGSSWANAIDSVQFRDNLYYAPYHDTFWVAKGIYHTHMSSQDSSFIIPSGVAVYGGFAGTETAISQRKLHTNISMLDGAGFTQNIVYFNGADSTTVLDGFTVANGYNSTGDGGKQGAYAGAAVFVDGGTLKCTPQITNDSFVNNAASSDGGAIYLYNNAGAYIANCMFTNNYTNGNDYGGAALFCLNYASVASKSVITNCTFSDNTSDNNAGAIGAYSNNTAINLTITACKFINNAATYGVGGAVYIYTPNVIDSPRFTNSVFFNNNATNNNTGYDMYIDGLNNMTITNCTFAQNGGATSNNSIFLNGQDTTKITNCIFWDNSNYELEYNNSYNGYYTVSYSDIFNGWTGAGSNNINANPLFVDSAAGNLQLLPCSPAVNTGTATGAPSVDILGNPRPTLGGYDMGAYQIQTAGLKPGVTALSHFCNGSSASIRANISGATSYQWQDSTTSGHWTNITNTTPYTGATSDTLNITSVTNALNGYTYRCLVKVSCGNYVSDSLSIKVSNPSSSVTSATACSDKLPYIWNGQSYNTTGIDTVYLVNKVGCDSMTILHLTIKKASNSTTTTSVCSNHLPYKWNGKNYISSGIDTAFLTNKAGCDSIAVLDLTINKAPDTTVSLNSGTLKAADSVGVTYQWINCGTHTTVSGATGRSYKPTKTGTYEVVLTSSPCADTSSCHYVYVAGITNICCLDANVSLYPNPANNSITIHIDNYEDEQMMQISDLSGRLVYSGKLASANTLLDITSFSSGMYVYTIYGNTTKATGKFVVQH